MREPVLTTLRGPPTLPRLVGDSLHEPGIGAVRVFFSVGEPSGDQHAAHLIEELRRREPTLEVEGYGGPRMEAAGCRLQYPLTNLAVMGLFPVVPLLWRFWRLIAAAKRQFRENPPDAVVLVDFPGFNWHIARVAKQQGIPVIYYLPPQLWGWASWRAAKAEKYVDQLLCGLPFEPAWYAAKGIPAEYVGHPFFDEVAETQLDQTFLEEQSNRGGRLVGLLPGSRDREVKRNWPMMLDVVERLAADRPDLRFAVANFQPEHMQRCRELAAERGSLPLEFHTGRTSEVIEAADCCLMVSGSVSLELLARETPAVVLYNAGRLMYHAMRRMIAVEYISLPNLFADAPLMPEFPTAGRSDQAVGEMADLLGTWLDDPSALAEKRLEMARVRQEVVRTGATARTAAAVLHWITTPPSALETAKAA